VSDTLRGGVSVSRNRIDSRTELFSVSGAPRQAQLKPDTKRSQPVRAHRSLVISLAIALVLAAPAAAVARRLIIDGSTSMLPLVQKLATAYHKAYPHIPAPKVGAGQSDVGIQDAARGRVDIGDSSRNAHKPCTVAGNDPCGLAFTKIAEDGICVITNPANPISTLSEEQVQAIFTGAVRDWSEVRGATISGPIDLFDRDGASGTQDAFQHIFLGEERKVSPSASEELSNGLEQNAVHNDKQAIGFVSFAFTTGVNAVGFQGVACNLRNAKSGQYGGVRNFWLVTKGLPRGAAAKFINWVTKPGNKTVRSIVNSNWIAIH
jgi:phosphate transport system substrate-binding protein